MADLAQALQTAQQAGYSDKQIADHLAADPGMGAKVAQARQAGYSDDEIVAHLAGTPAPAQAAPDASENVFQKAGRLTAENYQAADQAYRRDLQAATHDEHGNLKTPGIMDELRVVGDAASAAFSPVKGVMDATFGDKPVHLPSEIAGVHVPQALQNINSRGMTGGDIVSAVAPMGAELNAARETAAAAKSAGVGARTMEQTLQASRAGQSAAPVAAATPPNALQQTVQKFDQAGVRPTLAATGPGNATVAKMVAENPLAGVRARQNLQASLDDTARGVDRSAQAYGQPASRGATGEAVQQGVTDFKQRFSQRASNLYDPIFQKIEDAETAARAKVQAAAQAQNDARTLQAAPDASGDLPGQPSFAKSAVGPAPVIKPTALTQTVQDIGGRGSSPALKDLFQTPQLQKLKAAVEDPASISFDDLRRARTFVREAQNDNTLLPGIAQGDLKRLEGALTQDINTNASALAGPAVGRQLQQADQFYRLGSQRIQGALQRFLGRSGDASGESAYDMIQRMASDRGGADTGRLTALKKSLQPGDWGDVAATTISRMGQAPDGTFSVGRFTTAYDKLSQQGKGLLFGSGEQRQALDNLADVARMQQNVEKAANHSHSAVNAQTALTAGALMNPATAIPAAKTLGGMAITGEMLTNPAVIRWIVNLGKAQQVSPAAVSSAVGRLGAATRSNAALAPLFLEARKLVPQSAAAGTTSPGQTTPQ